MEYDYHMLLHASEINFTHPINQKNLSINANIHSEFKRMMELMDWL